MPEDTEVKEFVDVVKIPEDPEVIDEPKDEGEPAASSAAETSSEAVEPVTEPETQVDLPVEAKEIEGETPRERALRLEIERTRGMLRKERTKDLLVPIEAKIDPLTPDGRQKVLAKYDPEEVKNLSEVFDALAEQMGFVRKDELHQTTFTQRADSILQDFLEEHSEYLPEHDKDGVLWGRFKEEFRLYKQPDDPKDLKKVLNRVHSEIFGIKPAGANPQIQAQREKVKVASHAGAPARTTSAESKQNIPGLRTDMLKGFSEEELKEIVDG